MIDFLAKGYLYKEIAEQLKISYGTVHTYIERIFKKLHVRLRAQAMANYLRAKVQKGKPKSWRRNDA